MEQKQLTQLNKLVKSSVKRKKIEVKYIDTSAKCNDRIPQRLCESSNCSWFNHSQVRLH